MIPGLEVAYIDLPVRVYNSKLLLLLLMMMMLLLLLLLSFRYHFSYGQASSLFW